MMRFIKLTMVVAIAVGLCASGTSAETTGSAESTTEQRSDEQRAAERSKRIREHQDRIKTLLKESRERSAAQQQNAVEQRARREVEQSVVTGDTTLTSQTANKNQSSAEQERNRAESWRKFWEFYATPYDNKKTIEFRGSDQEYSNEAIKLKWHLGDGEGARRTLSYQWAGTTEPATMLELPDDGGRLLLQNSYHGIEISYPGAGSQEMKITENITNSDYHVASNVVAPRSSAPTRVNYGGFGVADGFVRSTSGIEFPITKKYGQVVNDWVVFLRDGTVYAQSTKDGTQIKVGSKEKDYRPVGSMVVGIEYLDKVTSAASVIIESSYYPHTLFATDEIDTLREILEKNGAEHATKLDVLNGMAEAYNFKITWADQQAQELAKKEVVTRELITGDSAQAMLRWIELILGDDFAPVAKGPEELHVALSDSYRADQELPAMIEKLRSDYKLETKLYVVKRIDPFNAMKVIKRDLLGCYVIGKPLPTDVTSDTLQVSGNYWSILKRSLSEKDDLEKELSKDKKLKNTMICEGIENDGRVKSVLGGGDAIVITATAETHGRIAAWLNGIEGEAQQTSLAEAANEPAPERRKLQITLLQGGKAGESAGMLDEKGTTATYQADVPAKFGMTPEDLKVLGFDGAVVAGRGIIDLVAKPGELGSSRLTLGGRYGVTVQYRQEQGGFLMIDAAIEGEKDEALAQNTIMLEKDKPSFLGVTNLSGAVIVVITWTGSESG